MENFELILDDQTFTVPKDALTSSCALFGNNPELCSCPYRVQTGCSRDVFLLFLDAVQGRSIVQRVTPANVAMLCALCAEFHFFRLAADLSHFSSASEFFPGRVAALEERLRLQTEEITALRRELSTLRNRRFVFSLTLFLISAIAIVYAPPIIDRFLHFHW
jgi:hypothetical protein